MPIIFWETGIPGYCLSYILTSNAHSASFFHPTTKQILEEYKNSLVLVYRHFPLDIHPKARKEAEATECAQDLGQLEDFWKFVDKIFEVTPSNNGLNPDELPKLAVQIGLNESRFKDCLATGKFTQKFKKITIRGLKLGYRPPPVA